LRHGLSAPLILAGAGEDIARRPERRGRNRGRAFPRRDRLDDDFDPGQQAVDVALNAVGLVLDEVVELCSSPARPSSSPIEFEVSRAIEVLIRSASISILAFGFCSMSATGFCGAGSATSAGCAEIACSETACSMASVSDASIPLFLACSGLTAQSRLRGGDAIEPPGLNSVSGCAAPRNKFNRSH